jgi:hypothetical protein
MSDIVDQILSDSDPFWFERDDNSLHEKVLSVAEQIEQEQSTLREAWKRYARAYSNRDEMGLDWNMDSSRELDKSFVTENVVKSVIDTAASIIAKNRVKVRVLTNGARFNDQRRARNLEKFVYGEMKARNAWEISPLIFRDACIFGTGVLKVFEKDKKVRLERKLISDILVDERSAIDGAPREMFERCLIDKEVLKSMFPKKVAEIELAATQRQWAASDIPSNQVVVVEAWRLKQGKKAGKHAICINGCTLLSEKYEEQYFPFVFFRWDGLPISGFYGLGLARDLHGIQTRINQLNVFIQRCQDLIAVPRVFVDMASKLIKVQIDNKIGAIIPYRGKPPTFFTPQALNSEIYEYKEQLKRSAFEFAGISQMSAQSLKPAGLESAVALREFNDIETNRFIIQAQRYERMYTEIGEMVIRIARRAYSKGTNMAVKFPDKNVLKEIDWSDVDLEEDRFSLDIQPASLLSMSPSARLQAVTELAQVGQLDKAEIRYLLNHPDLEQSNSMAYADYVDITRVEEALLNNEVVIPEPFQNLDLGLRRIQLLYLKVQNEYDDVPEEILEGIRTWISQAKSLQEQATQAGAPAVPQDPAAAAGEAPLAGGVAGSDVIQNLPGQIANV